VRNSVAGKLRKPFLLAALRGRTIFELGEFTGLPIDLDRSGVLLDDNMVAQRQTKKAASARKSGR
jgi:hypothetical protein